MNDNNKMDRGKEHAGPKKMTPRQKQKRNRKATLAAVLFIWESRNWELGIYIPSGWWKRRQ